MINKNRLEIISLMNDYIDIWKTSPAEIVTSTTFENRNLRIELASWIINPQKEVIYTLSYYDSTVTHVVNCNNISFDNFLKLLLFKKSFKDVNFILLRLCPHVNTEDLAKIRNAIEK